MRFKIAEMLITIGIPSFITLLVCFIQECRNHKIRELESKTQRDRAFTLIESEMRTMNISLGAFSQALSDIGSEVIGIRERIVRLEAQNRPD